MKVPSGMRILAGGGSTASSSRATRRVRAGATWRRRPGEDVLVGDLEPVEPLSLGRSSELADAKARAERRRSQRRSPARRSATSPCSCCCRHRARFPAGRGAAGRLPADALSQRLTDEIAKTGILNDFLEAMGRDVVASFQPREGRFFLENERTARGEKMLAAAIETDRPRHQRVAALEVLAASPPWPDDDDENEPLVERLAPLLSDPDPWVRAAAIEAAASWLGNAEWKRAATRVLRPALEAETDAEVLIPRRRGR